MRPRRGERRSAWRERREIPREDGRRAGKRRARRLRIAGGDGGIRTLDRALQPYNGLANRRLQPLGHVSGCAGRGRDMPDGPAHCKRLSGLRTYGTVGVSWLIGERDTVLGFSRQGLRGVDDGYRGADSCQGWCQQFSIWCSAFFYSVCATEPCSLGGCEAISFLVFLARFLARAAAAISSMVLTTAGIGLPKRLT